MVYINFYLFDWVVENLLCNVLDVMDGKGFIVVEIYDDQDFVYVDIIDSGKGILEGKFKMVFRLGYIIKK